MVKCLGGGVWAIMAASGAAELKTAEPVPLEQVIESLVRDLGALRTGFPRYRIAALQAFDMFPQTNHVETLALLER